MVDMFPSFSLFALYASDKVHILLELGTFHAHYTKHKNQQDIVLTLYEVYNETAIHITAN